MAYSIPDAELLSIGDAESLASKSTTERLTLWVHTLYHSDQLDELRDSSIREGWDILGIQEDVRDLLNKYLFATGDCARYIYFMNPRDLRHWYWGAINTLRDEFGRRLALLENSFSPERDGDWMLCNLEAMRAIRALHPDLQGSTIDKMVPILFRVVGPPIVPGALGDHVVPSSQPPLERRE